jgi:Domain of unknown function (DUF5666)
VSAIPYDSHDHNWDQPQQEPVATPGRPRRRFFNRKTAGLAAVLTCVGGFFAGVQVEKGQLASSGSASTTATAATAAARTGAGAGAASGFAARFGGAGAAGGAGGNASIGTIASVNGKTIYLTDTSGNTVKVTLSSSTKLTKSLSVSKSSLHPGDTIVVQGVKNSSGTLVATSVSDSGAGTTHAAASTGGSSTSSTATGGSSTAG